MRSWDGPGFLDTLAALPRAFPTQDYRSTSDKRRCLMCPDTKNTPRDSSRQVLISFFHPCMLPATVSCPLLLIAISTTSFTAALSESIISIQRLFHIVLDLALLYVSAGPFSAPLLAARTLTRHSARGNPRPCLVLDSSKGKP
ncbi:hypothetical protein F5883DRAFT_6514 [Diaporthe sp. PMI_573]|nr:hypothetical protein F5883DRAFT_6514 [Diaporthaceae sp. PMI_573]